MSNPLTADERRILDEMAERTSQIRLYNIAKMDEADVPSIARRGFRKATSYDHDYITRIERRDSVSEILGKKRHHTH
jgi:hypothetical protein